VSTQILASGLYKTYGSNTVVKDLDLQIEQGEFLVLLGPSGCGKTTTLRCLAGLETPTAGSIQFQDRTVFDAARKVDVSPNHRDIGMVFQSYALWPHMTVRRNIEYPLKVRKMKKAIAEGWAADMAKMVDCEGLLDRYPAQLSGGQQQRVALARGLVSQPQLVLFDEPLSNLDARLRDQVRTEIHQLHERLKFTAVFVTHDQTEALALGDRLAIMKAGRIEQFDTPRRVFENPVSEYVAAFIGMGNRIPLVRGQHGWTTSSGDAVTIPAHVQLEGDRAVARVRADDVELYPDRESVAPGKVLLAATFLTAEYGGRHYDVAVEYAGQVLHLKADVSPGDVDSWVAGLTEGEPVVAGFRPSVARYFGTPMTDDESSAVAPSLETV
jgi:iron(III) transport system ATP-binding protein